MNVRSELRKSEKQNDCLIRSEQSTATFSSKKSEWQIRGMEDRTRMVNNTPELCVMLSRIQVRNVSVKAELKIRVQEEAEIEWCRVKNTK